MLTLSLALAQGSVVGLICAGALWIVLDHRFVRKEEQILLETFGDEAVNYLDKTRRWL